MPGVGALANRRFLVLLVAVFGAITFMIVLFSGPVASNYSKTPIHRVTVGDATLKGGAIMPKLGNETLKAELGRASWKLFHTTMARFPDKPNADEQEALFSYIYLFARLYPCGECAGHFRQILTRFPPQVKSRSSAAVWACHVHNEVNKSLKKELFDCAKIGDFYDCGCAEDDAEKEKERGKAEDGQEKKPGEELKLIVDG
jgi:FAD-linked sulfhydryl oxidase